LRDLFGKCGNNCGHCPGFSENTKMAEARQRCSDGWYKYIGIRLSPETCRCPGCQAPKSEESKILNRGCRIRKCATKNMLTTCAECSQYPCIDLRWVFQGEPVREELSARIGSPIDEADYLGFLEPYEARKHLASLRSALTTKDIISPVQPPIAKVRLTPFPEKLVSTSPRTRTLKRLHKIISELKSEKGDTFARMDALEKRNDFILRLLWAFGRFGKRQNEDGQSLFLDGQTFREQKITSLLFIMIDYFEALKKYGIDCEVVPLVKEKDKWLMRSGWLRGKQ
jgi:hypothetical protein